MITLYQLHWSHYVEKVRWALDYKGVGWSAVEVDPFTKHQMHHLKCQTTLLRPAVLVQFFHERPRLQRLFAWRTTLLQEHRREPQAGYEAALHDTRDAGAGLSVPCAGYLQKIATSNVSPRKSRRSLLQATISSLWGGGRCLWGRSRT